MSSLAHLDETYLMLLNEGYAKEHREDLRYMRIAELYAAESKAERAKVGACLVTENGVILPGYNGTPPGGNNCCEHKLDNGELVTKLTVIHAELNCVMKAAREGISIKGCTIYVTLAPCESCAAMLASVGVKRVVYKTAYRCTKGIEELRNFGILVAQIKE